MDKYFLVSVECVGSSWRGTFGEYLTALVERMVGIVHFINRKPAVGADYMAAREAIIILGRNPDHAHTVRGISKERFDELVHSGIERKTINP